MKLILYSLKLELTNISLLAVHCIALVIVSYIVFQYYGAYYGTTENQINNIQYRIEVNLPTEPTIEQVEKCSDIIGFACSYIYSNESIEPDDESIYRCISFSGTLDLRIEGEELTDNSVYIPYSLSILNSIELGDKILLDDKEYKVAGISSDVDNRIIVSTKTLIDNFSVNSLEIYLDAALISREQYNTVTNELTGIFGDDAFIRTDNFDEMFQINLTTRKTEAIFLFLLGTICIVFVYSFILSKRTRRFAICSMCGAAKKTIVAMMCIGAMTVFTVSFIVSALLGKVINMLVFEQLFGYNTYSLSFEDFALFYIIMLAIYAVVTMFFTGKFVKNTAVNNYKRSE